MEARFASGPARPGVRARRMASFRALTRARTSRARCRGRRTTEVPGMRRDLQDTRGPRRPSRAFHVRTPTSEGERMSCASPSPRGPPCGGASEVDVVNESPCVTPSIPSAPRLHRATPGVIRLQQSISFDRARPLRVDRPAGARACADAIASVNGWVRDPSRRGRTRPPGFGGAAIFDPEWNTGSPVGLAPTSGLSRSRRSCTRCRSDERPSILKKR